MGCSSSSSSTQTRGPGSGRPTGKAPEPGAASDGNDSTADENQTPSDQMMLEPVDEAGERYQNETMQSAAGCASPISEDAASRDAKPEMATVETIISSPSENARKVQGEAGEKAEAEMCSETLSEAETKEEETGEAVDTAVTEIEAIYNEE